MKRRNKILYLMTVLCMVLFGMTMTVHAEYHQEGDFYYSLEFGKAYVEGYCGSGKDVVIPTTLGGCPVKGIWNMFRGKGNTYNKAESLYIPDTVETVTCGLGGDNLRTVRFSSNQKTIGENFPFTDCDKLEYLTNTQGIESIAWAAFRWCDSLKEVYFPNVTEVAGEAFLDCKALEKAHFPKLQKIGSSMFNGCTLLKDVKFAEDITSIGASAFSDCESLTSFTIPNTCETVGVFSFSGSGLTSLYVPSSVTTMYNTAFSNCKNLKTVDLDADIKILDPYMFRGCTNLESVTLPENLTWLKWNVFENCASLRTITIPHTVTKIDTSAFKGCERLCEIRGYKGTEAETFAKNKGIPFTGLNPKIILSYESGSLYVTGGFNKMKLGVRREGTSAGITFSSSKKSVATVNSEGVITAQKAGKATITVKCGSLTKKCKITVKSSKITVKTKPVTLKKGKTKQIQLSLTPQGKVTYKTTNKKIATVSKNGKIKAKKKGTCYIKISMKGATTRKLKVRVK